MMNKLMSPLGKEVLYNMKCRLDERMEKKLIHILKSLKGPGFLPLNRQSALNLDSKLFERLFECSLP
jgi:hypothetical protein